VGIFFLFSPLKTLSLGLENPRLSRRRIAWPRGGWWSIARDDLITFYLTSLSALGRFFRCLERARTVLFNLSARVLSYAAYVPRGLRQEQNKFPPFLFPPSSRAASRRARENRRHRPGRPLYIRDSLPQGVFSTGYRTSARPPPSSGIA